MQIEQGKVFSFLLLLFLKEDSAANDIYGGGVHAWKKMGRQKMKSILNEIH